MSTVVTATSTNGDLQHTITRDARAQSLLHVTAGAPDWEPSQEEMQAIADLFADATFDNKGMAVVVTRTGVQAQFVETKE